jgi:hypothetical protein
MKVKDLIKELEKLDQEREILTGQYEDCFGYYPHGDPYISEDRVMKYDYVTKKGRHIKGFEGKISNWIPNEYEEVLVYTIE